MKFCVTRTSSRWNEKPCEEADQERVTVGRMVLPRWYVEINNLEDLLAFEEKYGQIIISTNRDGTREIEIYDQSRE